MQLPRCDILSRAGERAEGKQTAFGSEENMIDLFLCVGAEGVFGEG